MQVPRHTVQNLTTATATAGMGMGTRMRMRTIYRKSAQPKHSFCTKSYSRVYGMRTADQLQREFFLVTLLKAKRRMWKTGLWGTPRQRERTRFSLTLTDDAASVFFFKTHYAGCCTHNETAYCSSCCFTRGLSVDGEGRQRKMRTRRRQEEDCRLASCHKKQHKVQQAACTIATPIPSQEICGSPFCQKYQIILFKKDGVPPKDSKADRSFQIHY
jgi:hypothetical protein